MFYIKKRTALYVALFAAAAFALFGLSARLKAESANKTVAFIVEYKDMASISYQEKEDIKTVWEKLDALGVKGVAASEFTGDELSIYKPLPVDFGAASEMDGVPEVRRDSRQAVLRVKKGLPYAPALFEYLRKKLPASELVDGDGDHSFIFLPGTVDEFKNSSFVPDFSALDFCRINNIAALFRPGPCTAASGAETADAFRYLTDQYPQIMNIIPAGLVAPGYPELKPLADVMKEKGISISQVEFVRQIGVPQLAKMLGTLVLPMHSLTRDEIIARNISRPTITDRFVRAVHERSIRLIMVHPYDLYMGGRFSVFAEDLDGYKKALEMRGYKMGWPKPMPYWPSPALGAFACGIALVFTLWFYASRFNGSENGNITMTGTALLFIVSAALGFAVLKVPSAARLAGGICGAFVAAEGAMAALESSYCRIRGAVAGLLIVVAGGLAIASFYGNSSAALRLTPFSGVKLTLLLPPLLLLAHDLKRRVHDEGLDEILVRSALWGELALIGLMLLALLVMALRSGNVSNVPAFEVAFRDFMEEVMVVRPRTKEFLIGYPALVIYWYLVRHGLIPHYREAVRIAAVLAFCSAVNTFCHFHTLLYLSVIRVFNGWWLGLLLGAAAAAFLHYVLLPLLRRSYRNN